MGFKGEGKLPDTAWHVGYAKKEEDDPRRHKGRCIHKYGDICHCAVSGCYLLKCGGSSHCRTYAESELVWEEYLEDMMTDEDKEKERAFMYRLQKQGLVRELLKNGDYHKKYSLRQTMKDCPFCQSKLKDMKCEYCGAQFRIVDDIDEQKIKQYAGQGIFIVKKTKKSVKSSINKNGICYVVHHDRIGMQNPKKKGKKKK